MLNTMVQKFLKNLFFSDKNKGPTEKNSVDFLGKQLGQKEISFNLLSICINLTLP